jgi:hypothetical protein
MDASLMNWRREKFLTFLFLFMLQKNFFKVRERERRMKKILKLEGKKVRSQKSKVKSQKSKVKSQKIGSTDKDTPKIRGLFFLILTFTLM